MGKFVNLSSQILHDFPPFFPMNPAPLEGTIQYNEKSINHSHQYLFDYRFVRVVERKLTKEPIFQTDKYTDRPAGDIMAFDRHDNTFMIYSKMPNSKTHTHLYIIDT